MKGLSLPIQAVVFLIIAALVLTSMIMFYLSSGGGSQQNIANIAKQTDLCQQYTRHDLRCEDVDLFYDDFDDPRISTEIMVKIVEVCENLGNVECTSVSPDASLECIQVCCSNFCRR